MFHIYGKFLHVSAVHAAILREAIQWAKRIKIIQLLNRQNQYKIFYLIIRFNLIVPTLLSPVGGPLSGNGCGSPNHIKYMLFLYYLLLY
jgi:hypothetical protein